MRIFRLTTGQYFFEMVFVIYVKTEYIVNRWNAMGSSSKYLYTIQGIAFRWESNAIYSIIIMIYHQNQQFHHPEMDGRTSEKEREKERTPNQQKQYSPMNNTTRSIKGELFCWMYSVTICGMEKSAMIELVYEHYRNFYVDRKSDNEQQR